VEKTAIILDKEKNIIIATHDKVKGTLSRKSSIF
jgi:hypothetical protein